MGTDVRIVILQRGWVLVGRFQQDGQNCSLENCFIIRRWGTTKGLGELAKNGPLKETILDPCPRADFHELTVVFTLRCTEGKWSIVTQ